MGFAGGLASRKAKAAERKAGRVKALAPRSMQLGGGLGGLHGLFPPPPFMGLLAAFPLPFLDLPRPFHRLPLAFHCPFIGLSLPFPLPSVGLPLPFHWPTTASSTAFPLSFHCHQAAGSGSARRRRSQLRQRLVGSLPPPITRDAGSAASAASARSPGPSSPSTTLGETQRGQGLGPPPHRPAPPAPPAPPPPSSSCSCCSCSWSSLLSPPLGCCVFGPTQS